MNHRWMFFLAAKVRLWNPEEQENELHYDSREIVKKRE